MAKFLIRKSSVDNVRKNLAAYAKKRRKHFELGMVVWADGTITEIRNELAGDGAFDQGILSAATQRTEPTWSGMKLKVIVFNPMEYASVIEFGRRPGKGKPPPLLAIVGWASRKGIVRLPRNISFNGEWKKKWAASGAILRNMKKGGGKSGGKKKPLDPVIRDLLIVRLIARKIFEKGTRARYPFSKAFERRLRVLKKEVADTLALLK